MQRKCAPGLNLQLLFVTVNKTQIILTWDPSTFGTLFKEINKEDYVKDISLANTKCYAPDQYLMGVWYGTGTMGKWTILYNISNSLFIYYRNGGVVFFQHPNRLI